MVCTAAVAAALEKPSERLALSIGFPAARKVRHTRLAVVPGGVEDRPRWTA